MVAKFPPLVSVGWLAARLPAVKVIDASWYLPAMGRDARGEFATQRIPGARFFDLDDTDDTSGLPHMLPSTEHFAQCMSSLGLRTGDHVICYDGKGIFSAPRLWWVLRANGHPEALPYLPLTSSRRPYLSRCASLPAKGRGLLRSTTHINAD